MQPPSDRSLARRLAAALERTPDALVPPAFQFLWGTPRFLVPYGGRASGKSWSIARVLLVLAAKGPLRVLCCREIQGSIKESAYRLLCDQIVALDLDERFEVQSDSIIGRCGSRFYFEGLRYNASRIRSYEGVDIVWCEEAQNISELSWETLLPTVRKSGSRFFISFNPMTKDDPVLKRFVDSKRPDCIAKKVSWRDNPFLSPEALAEREWLEKTDPDSYRHVWEGFPRTISDALILKGKYEVAEFEISPEWAGPYHGLDYGFARDPSAAVRCYIDDGTRTLYISHEWWALACDIDAIPASLEAAIPAISRHVVYADAARPETTSYLSKNGIANARSAEKWPGSIDDGIAYLRSFERIVIAPACKHLIDEVGTYSFKTDRLTNSPLPEAEDKNNHLIDALRYALSPLIRNQPAGGYFNRAALLVEGAPLDQNPERVRSIFITVATCARPTAAVGVVFWASSPNVGWPLLVLDYDLVEIEEALDPQWLAQIFERADELRAELDPVDRVTPMFAESGELFDALVQVFKDTVPAGGDLVAIDTTELPATLDERAERLRAAINGGRCVKLMHSAYARQTAHRSITANHLANQVFGFRPGAKDAATELAGAFALGCLASYASDGTAPVRARPTPQPPSVADLEDQRLIEEDRAILAENAIAQEQIDAMVRDCIARGIAPPSTPDGYPVKLRKRRNVGIRII